MATLRGPLLSLAASGQFAKTIVYGTWKGLKWAREYVVPANPDTPLQRVQRGYFEDAVDEWHEGKYTASDKTAWNRYAAILAKPMSGFNAFVRTWLDLARLALTDLNPPWAAHLITGGVGLFDYTFMEDGEATSAFIQWGYSPTALNTQSPMTELAPNDWTISAVAATSGMRVYARGFSNAGADVQGRTGILYLDIE